MFAAFGRIDSYEARQGQLAVHAEGSFGKQGKQHWATPGTCDKCRILCSIASDDVDFLFANLKFVPISSLILCLTSDVADTDSISDAGRCR